MAYIYIVYYRYFCLSYNSVCLIHLSNMTVCLPIYMSLSVCLSVYLSILPIFLPARLFVSVYLSTYLYILSLPTCTSVGPPNRMSVCCSFNSICLFNPSIYSTCRSTYLQMFLRRFCLCLSVHLHICTTCCPLVFLSVCLNTYLPERLSIYRSICLFICLSSLCLMVCLFIWSCVY